HRKLTETVDRVIFVNVSRDIWSWLTPYGAYKFYKRLTNNRTWEYQRLTSKEAIVDKLEGYGAGLSFNVGKERNTHIMFEVDELKDTDEPAKHYQKQAGMGISVEF
ncbi:MAG: hypothetical protein HY747_02685, partial [Elusimicrobia bacterium]|nr:hypothetical protein [Elusimicrobiota bacterium]